MQKYADSEKTDEVSVLLIQPFNLKIYFYNFKLKNTFVYLLFPNTNTVSNAMWIYIVYFTVKSRLVVLK